MITRRVFLHVNAGGITSLVLGGCLSSGGESEPSSPTPVPPVPALDPATIPKYQALLVIPPAMPQSAAGTPGFDYYEIGLRQFRQQVLPPGLPSTTVYGYGSISHPETFNYPAYTIEARCDRPLRVKWINQLVDADGKYLPHPLPVDQTLDWANPPGGEAMRDHDGAVGARYTGPVPMVVHVHGAHVTEDSDGYPEAWYLPAAADIPAGYATVGSWYPRFQALFKQKWGVDWSPGLAIYQYANAQRATTLWYHDHTLGMTRVNVYAGTAGFYILRGGASDLSADLPGPAPAAGDAPGTRYYEIPLAIQDRSFRVDGSLFYPDGRAFFEGIGPDQLRIPTAPQPVVYPDGTKDGISDVPPIWNPEFFGDTMLVNGRTWPTLGVEPRRYRFRLLNGCNARFLMLRLVNAPPPVRPTTATLPFWQIGSDGGFLPQAVQQESLLVAPAERADVVVDFTGLPVGTELYLINEGPDEPYGGGTPGVDFEFANPTTTGQVMRFVVGKLLGLDTSTPPAQLVLPAFTPLGPASRTRQVSLNELESRRVRVRTNSDGSIVLDKAGDPFGPTEAVLGTVGPDGTGVPISWDDEVTETIAAGSTEVWEIYNYTADAHPIHVHQTMFELVGRQPFEGEPRPPEPTESGFKDTVIAYPGEITRIKAKFDLAGRYVWHCHILEHEDNEMMRPIDVVPS